MEDVDITKLILMLRARFGRHRFEPTDASAGDRLLRKLAEHQGPLSILVAASVRHAVLHAQNGEFDAAVSELSLIHNIASALMSKKLDPDVSYFLEVELGDFLAGSVPADRVAELILDVAAWLNTNVVARSTIFEP